MLRQFYLVFIANRVIWFFLVSKLIDAVFKSEWKDAASFSTFSLSSLVHTVTQTVHYAIFAIKYSCFLLNRKAS